MALYEFASTDVVVGKPKLVHLSLTKLPDTWLLEMFTETAKGKYQNYNQVSIPDEIIQPSLALMLIGILQSGCKLRLLTGRYDVDTLTDWVSQFSSSFMVEKIVE